jgi:hypothetical protein
MLHENQAPGLMLQNGVQVLQLLGHKLYSKPNIFLPFGQKIVFDCAEHTPQLSFSSVVQ